MLILFYFFSTERCEGSVWVCGECKRPFPRQFIVERHIKHKHFWKPNLKEAFFSLPLEDMVDNVPSVSVKDFSLSLFFIKLITTMKLKNIKTTCDALNQK